jgi:2-methylisocitrate lyase-like PEP mutase family enzyme
MRVMSNYSLFKALHQQNEPLLLGNAWNVSSARILQENGIKAIATSSSAIADTLGYEDGERIPFAELFFIVEKIAKQVTVPLSADIERGYSGDVNVVVNHIEQLHDIGVVGINLEDSVQAEQLVLGATDSFCQKLAFIKNKLAQKNIDLFINARTDTFLLQVPDALAETLTRIKAYQQAGADSIFVPFIKDVADISTVTAATSLPVNVLALPDLPSFDILKEAGVKRISMGGSIYRSINNHLKQVLYEISNKGSF